MYKNVVSAGLLIFGLAGMFVSILGVVTSLGEYNSAPPRSWEQFDLQLVNETPDFASLQKRVRLLTDESLNEQEKMLIIYNEVIRRFTHSDPARYNIYSNWFLWLIGTVHPSFSSIGKPDILLKNGHSGLCSQQTYLLQVLAGTNGIHNRKVGLNGHVVMEAWYDNDWHLFDPDLEVVPITEGNRILSLDDLAKSPALLEELYQGSECEECIGIIASRKDNSASKPYPKPTINLYVEQAGGVIKWFFPILMIFFALYLRRAR
ncbi:MAG: transglutaminase-like domain-containing protein [Pseudomonadales bacterium]|nr:transglutaminase-like domain-containing protein [Pseudomonadales bacterium]